MNTKSTLPCMLLPFFATLSPASAADWRTRPPVVTELTAEKLAQPLAEGSARIQVRFADQGLPAVLPLHLDRMERSLRDDGQGADPVAGDGRYAAIIPLNAGPLAALARKVRQQPALVDREGRFLGSRFEGREQRTIASVPPLDFAAWEKGLPVFLEPFRTASDANLMWDRSLMIVHSGVVDSDEAKAMGAWSFGHLFAELARKHNVSPMELARRWLAHWEQDQVVNGFTIPQRSGIGGLIARWQQSGFDPAQAPFRLLAIVHRIDLRHDILLGGPSSAGENRFVFCAVDAGGNPMQFTVIFEYGIQVANVEEVRQEGIKWANLQTWEPGTPIYNDNLKILTEETVRVADGTHARLDQLRTNEIELGSPWQLREFKISNGPDDTGFFRMTTTKQTPDNSLGKNAVPAAALAGWANANAADVLLDRHILPAALPPPSATEDFFRILGGGSDEDGLVWLTGQGLAAPLRHHFALNTCNGCHQPETGTGFTHIKPRPADTAATLSGFMTGIEIEDPGSAGFKRRFDEKTRRADDLDLLINFPGIFQLTHRPLLMEH